jgi:hypothetical protein
MKIFQQVYAATLFCFICVALQATFYTTILSSYHLHDESRVNVPMRSTSFRGETNAPPPATRTMTPPVPPTCRLYNIHNRTINRIYFLHMRKAGGTSLRSYFFQVARKHHVEFVVAEGLRQPEQPGDDANTLYITNIRPPIARAISSYKYERRWLCRTQLQYMYNNSRNNDQDGALFVPTLNNTYMSLDNYTRSHHYRSHDLWICASNCYARWATGRPEHVEYDNPVQLQELEQAARASLWNYNIIIVTEWLYQNPDYVKSIESIFGVKHPHRTVDMMCGKEAAAANQQFPLLVQPQELELLAKVNQVDLQLYQDLTACQPQLLQEQQQQRHDDDNDNVVHHGTTFRIQWNGTSLASRMQARALLHEKIEQKKLRKEKGRSSNN